MITQRLDKVAIAILLVLGVGHTIMTPVYSPGLTAGAAWFAGSGLALLFAAFLNLGRRSAPVEARRLRTLCAAANVLGVFWIGIVTVVMPVWQAFLAAAALLVVAMISLAPVQPTPSPAEVMTPRTRFFLIAAGVGSATVSALHVVLAFSVRLCRFCRAPEQVLSASLPARIGMVLVVAATFGAFAAIVLWPLVRRVAPRRPLVFGLGGIYCLRGLVIVPESLALLGAVELPLPVEPQMPFFSLASLLIGLAHVAGGVGLHRPAVRQATV